VIGDEIIYHKGYEKITDFVIEKLASIQKSDSKLCISVGGESGCGKTSLAYALQKDIENNTGLKSFIFHLDDYFKLPPTDNHNARLNDISKVGSNEVNLDLLDSHLIHFKEKSRILNKPLVDYHQNKILKEHISCSEFDFCIVEGTYASLLKNPDYKLFIKTTYLETLNSRIERSRDIINDFNKKVLEIEHQIIRNHKGLADVIIDKDLRISKPKKQSND